jgi:hypothetical protein
MDYGETYNTKEIDHYGKTSIFKRRQDKSSEDLEKIYERKAPQTKSRQRKERRLPGKVDRYQGDATLEKGTGI